MVTVSSTESVLKDYYLDAVNAQIDGEVSPFFSAITKTSENVFGREVRIGIVKNGLSSIRACDEDEDLPSPHSNRYYYINEPLKNIYGTIELSDKLIRTSSDSTGAMINMLNSEMSGLIAGARANFARMLYGNGNGLIMKVVRKISTYVLEVEDAKSMYVNYPVQINASSGTITATITKIDTETNYITVNKSLDSATINGGENISVQDASGKELKGLAYLFDGTTVYGYNKTAEPFFKPYVTSVARADLCEDDLMSAMDYVEAESGSKTNMILCSFKTRRLIAKLFESSKQIVNTTDINAGATSIYINAVPVYADAFCPDGRIYFLNTNDFVLCQLCDWSWLENESGKILTQVSGKAAFTATLVKYAELICRRPCGQGMIQLTD
ncbi:MAG: phage major capsid protein [Candidatus Coproplasma sp.]